MSNTADGLVRLLRSCQKAEFFPSEATLLDEWPRQRKHHLQNHLDRLGRRKDHLFQKEEDQNVEISLNFLELDDGNSGFKKLLKLTNLAELQRHLNLAQDSAIDNPSDPRVRFV